MRENRKIAINASMLDEHPTGVGVYTYNLANTLSALYKKENNHNITVFTPFAGHLNKDINIVKISDLVQSSRHRKTAALYRFLWNTFLYPFAGRKYDLLISTTTHGSFTLRNQVITIHDLLSLRYNNISFHQRVYFKYLLPLLIKRSRLVITVSEATRQEIVRLMGCPPQKIHVVYNGYNKQVYNTTPEKEKHIQKKYHVSDYILAVGPTYPHKNFELLITAYGNIDSTTRRKHPLLIAGGMKPYVNKLKEFVKTAGLEDQVHFTGYIPADLMPSLYKEALFLVFPSLYEGFGFPLLEAMACGCPVTCSNTSSIPEVCGNAAIYFNPDNKAELTRAMNEMIKKPEIRNDLRRKGLAQSSLFSWESSAEKLKRITDHIIVNN
jgi:glycosyltransferase involved in cell wall biosynthesis